MEVILYNNVSDEIVVNKTIEQIEILTNVTLENDCSLINPILILKIKTTFPNYVYIQKFNRYYYVKNYTILDNGRYRLECSVDVLMSFKDEFLNTTQNVIRQENMYNLYLKDDEMQILSYVQRQTLNFDTPADGWTITETDAPGSNCFVLNCIS